MRISARLRVDTLTAGDREARVDRLADLGGAERRHAVVVRNALLGDVGLVPASLALVTGWVSRPIQHVDGG